MRTTCVIRKIMGRWTKGLDPVGWHVFVKSDDGEWESWSGPHYSIIVAGIAARDLGLEIVR